ncbi:hypothetical protein DERP_012808 [Dermatophagoides pteronyssinus]|uniref:Uncharacterized protein n=1 Tax=Dermatophagoides pteronyssinus TaxID=6956 RepID=A0ABQ8JF39_DERPT|nr:hypothetical protein DERP_012808 [Dermatophagoides pteronyssinus]
MNPEYCTEELQSDDDRNRLLFVVIVLYGFIILNDAIDDVFDVFDVISVALIDNIVDRSTNVVINFKIFVLHLIKYSKPISVEPI